MATVRSERPRMVGWEITRRCNLSCQHCYTAATKKPLNEMTTAECFGVVDQLVELGTEVIGWTGGEPLLRDDLEQIMAYAKAKGGIRSGITTNGILLTAERAKRLQDAGVYAVQISIDGSTAEKNRVMRGATLEEFNVILAGIRACKEIGLTIDLAMLLGRATLEDAVPFLRMAEREGARGVRYCGFVPWGRGKRKDVTERLMFDGQLAALRDFIAEAIWLEQPVAMFDPAFGPTPPNYEYHDCVAGREMFYMKCNGEVYPCTSLLDTRFMVGSLRERPLREIWNDPKMVEMSEFPRDQIHGHCRECDSFGDCQGACRGVTYAHTGDLYASFPVCLKRAQAVAEKPA